MIPYMGTACTHDLKEPSVETEAEVETDAVLHLSTLLRRPTGLGPRSRYSTGSAKGRGRRGRGSPTNTIEHLERAIDL
jgi:hypothetical protein